MNNIPVPMPTPVMPSVPHVAPVRVPSVAANEQTTQSPTDSSPTDIQAPDKQSKQIKLWREYPAQLVAVGDVIKTHTYRHEIIVANIERSVWYGRDYIIFTDTKDQLIRAYSDNTVWKLHSLVSE